MDHRDGNFTKMDYAKHLAASLGWLAHAQGDSFGLYIFRGGELFSLPSRKDPQHLARFFYQLEHIQPAGSMGNPTQYKHIFTRYQNRALPIFIPLTSNHAPNINLPP